MTVGIEGAKWLFPFFSGLMTSTLTGFQTESLLPLDEVLEFMEVGEYAKARERLSKAGDENPHVLRLQLELSRRLGNTEESRRYAKRLLSMYDEGVLQSPSEIAEAAYAAWKTNQWKRANRLYLEASRDPELPLWVYVDWGYLYLEKYNGAEAESIFQDALELPSLAGWSRWGRDAAQLGLAQALKSQHRPGVENALREALDQNPQNLDGHALKGLMAMEVDDWKGARHWISKGLDRNPKYVPLLELECVFLHFQGEIDSFQTCSRKLMEINRHNGNLYQILGDFSVARRRMEEAVEYYREALRKNPKQWSALGSLGVNLLRLAQEEEGRKVLQRAYENDPFNIATVNTLRLVDSFDRFVRKETSRYWLRIHQKEAVALEPYVRKLLDRSISFLEKKYRHQVEHKFQVEIYPDHEDFAVRTLGIPGLGAFGATFGRILAMDSPSARARGTYHWGSTLWHEMAHVVILSLSRGRVPRWLTEGISMMEERLAGEGWGDRLTPSFVRAYEQGEIRSLKELNKGFESPRTREDLEISYLQAGWVCEFLDRRYGIEKMRNLVESFGKGLSIEEAVSETLQVSVDDLNMEFLQEVSQVLNPLIPSLKRPAILRNLQGSQSRNEYLKSLLEALDENKGNYHLNLVLGETLDEAGRSDQAVPYLEKAIQTFPNFASQGSPYPILARIYKKAGEKSKLTKVLKQWFNVAPQLAENGVWLAKLLVQRNRIEQAATVLEKVLYSDTLNPEVHRLLGNLYLQMGKGTEAVMEFQVLLGLSPFDKAEAHFQLARALYLSGATPEARRQVLLALEIAPGYRDAQKFLLELVRR